MTPTADDLARDPYELANQLSSYIGPDTPEPLAEFLRRQSAEAVRLADLLTALEARQAQLIEALRFYANAWNLGHDNFIEPSRELLEDCGQRARTLIKETGNG